VDFKSIKYRGLKDGPVLATGEGRFPPVPPPGAGTPAGGVQALLETGDYSQLKLKLLQKEQQRVLQQVEARIRNLSLAIDQMHVPADDLVSRAKTAVSPEPQALSAQADEQAATPATHSVEVQWPARGGKVVSQAMNPIEYVSLAAGTQTLNFTIDGTTHELSIEVHPSSDQPDTQEDLLRRMARAINGLDSRVQAQVKTGLQDAYDPAPRSRPMNRVVWLEVNSTQSGQGVDFYFSDGDDSTLAQTYGLTGTLPRRAASLMVQGARRRQAGNQISLDDGHVIAQAKDSTSGLVDIAVSQGAGVITGELKKVIGLYNDLVSYLDRHAELLRPSLKDRVVRPLEERAGLMPRAGLWANANGSIRQGDNFADRILSDFSRVRSVLLGEGGWSGALKQKLDQILSTGLEPFAAELPPRSELTARREAQSLLMDLSGGIISAYA